MPRAFAAAGGGWVIAQAELTPATLAERLAELLADAGRARRGRRAARRLRPRRRGRAARRGSFRAWCRRQRTARRSRGARGMRSLPASDRPHPFRRHRRHRHERHRRDAAQSRLPGAGQRRRRRAPTRSRLAALGIAVTIGHAAENLGARRGRRRLVGGQARQSRGRRRRARAACRWCAAPRCWAS